MNEQSKVYGPKRVTKEDFSRVYVPGPEPGCNCKWCLSILRGEVVTTKDGRFVRVKA